jgi:hypothetical protein
MYKRHARLLILITALSLCALAWLTSTWWLGYTTGAFDLVEDGLYIGGAVERPPLGTHAVLNVCEHEDTFAVDAAMWEPFPREATVEWLERVVDFVAGHRAAGRTVFVHCHAGETRSATVVTAYLMRRYGWSRDEAIAFLAKRRPQLKLTPSKFRLLDEWQQRVNAERGD